MKIIFFAHPLFLGSQSMPRFVTMLVEGMQRRGYKVEIWRPQPVFYKLPITKLKKWLGYIDQYIVFPQVVRRKIKNESNTLYVVTDNALGPYVPLIADKQHVVHCHDFLAQRSALGEVPENLTSLSGRKYQAYIHRGYSRGSNFISVSEKTKVDLEQLLGKQPLVSEVIYNGLNTMFEPGSLDSSRVMMSKLFNADLSNGYILHVGGNQWYKNRIGVIEIYDQWRKRYGNRLSLLLIGQNPSARLLAKYDQSPYKQDIHFFSGAGDNNVQMAYTGATVFLFPSLAEGFGWPIAEAMASGTLVVTTNEAPMLEVAGDAAFLIDRMPHTGSEQDVWSKESAEVLQRAVTLNENERGAMIKLGIENIKRFDLEMALDRIEQIYLKVFNNKTEQSVI